MPPGKPDGGTSPVLWLRLPQDGGADPSPRNHRHDRCSRWEELAGIMKEGKGAWREGAGEKCERQQGQRVAGTACADFSTFSPASPAFVILGRSRSASERWRPEDPCQSIAGVHIRCRTSARSAPSPRYRPFSGMDPRVYTSQSLSSGLPKARPGGSASPEDDEGGEVDAPPHPFWDRSGRPQAGEKPTIWLFQRRTPEGPEPVEGAKGE